MVVVGDTADAVTGSARVLDRGVCLCLSGGGFRATLFHLGGLVRLNELGVLSRLAAIASVSGGSILNGLLAARWSQLALGPGGVFTNFVPVIGAAVRRICSTDLRTRVLIGERLRPANWPYVLRDWGAVAGNILADAYEPQFRCMLVDVPGAGDAVPRFIFCATNVATGLCWHFHAGPSARMGDFHHGYFDAAGVRVSDAVAASSAFPPGFSAFRLKLAVHPASRIDPWGDERVPSAKRRHEQHHIPGRPVLLTDGGVYDNLAVEPVWRTYRTLLISDAGRPFTSNPGCRQHIIARLKRVADISMEQVAAVRKRWFFDQLAAGRRLGAIWTLHSMADDFPVCGPPGYHQAANLLNAVRTDLNAFTRGEMACLINHGYWLADAAVRSHAAALCHAPAATFYWPEPDWCGDAKAILALALSHRRQYIRDAARYVVG